MAINVGEFHYSSGSVEGIPFTACTSNTDIIILASNFQRLQLISDPHNVSVSCIDCSTDVGKIAAAYGRRIVIYEPVPMLSIPSLSSNSNLNSISTSNNSSQKITSSNRAYNTIHSSKDQNNTKLDYKWIHTATFEADYAIEVISLNLEGTKLISGGHNIQMWHLLIYDQNTLPAVAIDQHSMVLSSVSSTDVKAENVADANDDDDETSMQEGPNQPRPRGLSIVMQHLGIQQQQSNHKNQGQHNIVESSRDEKKVKEKKNCEQYFLQKSRMCWQCVWRCLTANQVYYLKFSPDGTLFCSAGKNDRLVKIWYETTSPTNATNVSSCPPSAAACPTSPLGSRRPQPAAQPDRSSVNFSFIYIAHPRAVTGFSWRKTSKYTPRGSVANVLITSCQDNISRLWVQTLLPDDGLVNFGQLRTQNLNGQHINNAIENATGGNSILRGVSVSSSSQSAVHTQRHRQKLLQRLKRMKAFSQFGNKNKKIGSTLLDDQTLEEIANTGDSTAHLPSTLSAHDFHSYAMCATAIIPGLHFHLAGSMDVNIDHQQADNRSLSSSFKSYATTNGTTANEFLINGAGDCYSRSHFVVHWINNKEIAITRAIEKLLHDMLMRILKSATQSATSALASGANGDNHESCNESSHSDISDNEAMTGDEMTGPTTLDTIDAESGKKLRHKLCHRINKQRAMAASGRHENDIENDTVNSNRSSVVTATGGGASTLSLVEEFDRYLDELLRKWQSSADLLFNINPLDGSLTIWQVHFLDGEGPGSFRQVQIDQVSSIKSALPAYDSITVSINMTAYSQSTYQDVKRAYLAVMGAIPPELDPAASDQEKDCNRNDTIDDDDEDDLDTQDEHADALYDDDEDYEGSKGDQSDLDIQSDIDKSRSKKDTRRHRRRKLRRSKFHKGSKEAGGKSSDPNLFIVTQHLSGTIGLWKLHFDANYPHVQSVDLVTRITGLPMHPTWLCDGILILDYDHSTNSIITEWRQITPPNQQDKGQQSKSMTNKQNLKRSVEGQRSLECQSQCPQLPPLAEELSEQFDHVKVQNYAREKEISSNKLNESKDIDLREEISASRFAQYRMVLPQYHVKQLIELLAFGRLPRVKAILNHLVNCLAASEPSNSILNSRDNNNDSTSVAGGPWASHRSRTLSIVAQSPPVFNDSEFDFPNHGNNPSGVQQQTIEEIELDYTEVTSIRALPLHCVLAADTEKSQVEDSKPLSKDEFSSIGYDKFMHSRSTVEETIDEILGQSTLDTLNKRNMLDSQQTKYSQDQRGPLASFGPRKAKLLTKMLTHIHLPGLTNLEQVHLLAVADAVASFDANNESCNNNDSSLYSQVHMSNSYYHTSYGVNYGDNDYGGTSLAQDNDCDADTLSQRNIAIDSLDDCGLRYLLGMLQHIYLTRCLPIQPRKALCAAGIGSKNIIWAFHSETQDELISLIPCVQRNKPTWSELAEYGVGWWIRKIEVLRKLMEKVAQCAYQQKSDPLDAALYYLAMKKKTLVCALLRRVNCDKRLLQLFEQDFSNPVNRKKALKNAYALLGLHRYEHAAAFFILAGSIWDAVEVCLNKMNDIQLAIVLIRLHDSDVDVTVPENLRKVLYLEILGHDPSFQGQTSSSEGRESLNQNLNNQMNEKQGQNLQNSSLFSQDGIFDNKPDQHQTSLIKADSREQKNRQNEKYLYYPTRASKDPFLRSMAFWILGDYLLSVGTLLDDVDGINNPTTNEENSEQQPPAIDSAVFNFYLYLRERPLIVRRRQSIVDEHEQLFFSTANSYLRDGCPLLALEVLSRVFDKRAQQLKFIACTHLLLDELNTLAVGCTENDDPGQQKLRHQLYEWLEKSVEALKSVSNYAGRHIVSSSNGDDDLQNTDHVFESPTTFNPTTSSLATRTATTGEGEDNQKDDDLILLGPKGLNWLKTNEPLLRTMLTYCNLHGATDQNLFTIRHELMQLLSLLESN